MDYNQSLEYIHGALKFGVKLGLHNIGVLLKALGNPHKKLKYVHVAGTNGKGSTVSFISRILMEAGYRVGIYTSPYLERFTERIKINNCEISQSDLARLTTLIKSKIDEMVARGENHPTEFELITALAFQYFNEQKCDIVILEVGLGGRFDSTNIIDTPLAAVISTINYDHVSILGNTLGEIAFEKAGIIKELGDVVLYPQQQEAEEVIEDVCLKRGATLHKVDLKSLVLKDFDIDGQVFDYDEIPNLKIKLLGEHQVKNAVLALNAIKILIQKGFNISSDNIRTGLLNTIWPGRMEIIHKNPLIILDGAHNPEGILALKQTLIKYFSGRRFIFVIGVLKDKEYKVMIESIASMADMIITVTPNNIRALPSSELANIVKNYCDNVIDCDKIGDAMKIIQKSEFLDDVICVFGSLYYIGEVRSYFAVE